MKANKECRYCQYGTMHAPGICEWVRKNPDKNWKEKNGNSPERYPPSVQEFIDYHGHD